jgi:hypothetical protein
MHPNINHQSKTGFLQKISSLDDRPKHSDWRDQFNREVFKTTFRDQPLGSVSFRHPEAKKTLPPDLQSLIDNSSTYTIKDVNDIIQCIKLDPKNDDLSSSFAYAKRSSSKFQLHTSHVPSKRKPSKDSPDDSTTVPLLQIFKEKSGIKKFICPAEKVFDEIYWAHAKVGHKKTFSTFKGIDKKFLNIPRTAVQRFIDICPICASTMSDRTRKKNSKGPGVAIKSLGFRDRIQVDLINYTSCPALDHNSVTMKYLMTVKDHFSRYIWLRPLAQKESRLVAAELRHLFHEIGFPLIFHTDNGTEFISKKVYDLLKDHDDNILTVSGKPRTPRVQGSVENANRHVKIAISNAINAGRLKNQSLTWVDVLGPVTSALNTAEQKGTNGLSPYKLVFTQNFELNSYAIPSEMHKTIRSVEDLKNAANDPELSQVLEEMNASDIDEDDQAQKHQLPDITSNEMKPTINAQLIELSSDDSDYGSSIHDKVTFNSGHIRRNFYACLGDVMLLDPMMRQLRDQDINQEFEFVSAARFKESFSTTYNLLQKHFIIDLQTEMYDFAGDRYLNFCMSSQRYLEIDLLRTFAHLKSLDVCVLKEGKNPGANYLLENNLANYGESCVDDWIGKNAQSLSADLSSIYFRNHRHASSCCSLLNS